MAEQEESTGKEENSEEGGNAGGVENTEGGGAPTG